MEDITQQCWYVFIPLEAMLSAVLAGICLRLSLRPIRSRIVSKWGKNIIKTSLGLGAHSF